MLLVKLVVLLLLGFVVISLFSGLFFLVKDKGQTTRTVNALSLRIGLSILAILIIVVAAATGRDRLQPQSIQQHSPNRTSCAAVTVLHGTEHRPRAGQTEPV